MLISEKPDLGVVWCVNKNISFLWSTTDKIHQSRIKHLSVSNAISIAFCFELAMKESVKYPPVQSDAITKRYKKKTTHVHTVNQYRYNKLILPGKAFPLKQTLI